MKKRPLISHQRLRRISGALFLFGASCATPFQAKGLRGGYADTRIANDTVLASFNGNGFTSKERVQLYLLYRCAEVTKHDGFDYFVITGGNTEAKVNYIQTPSTYNETTTGFVSASGNGAFGSAQTFGSISPGATVPVHKYGAEALIKMFHGQKPSNDPNAYDAGETIRYLGPDLGLVPQ